MCALHEIERNMMQQGVEENVMEQGTGLPPSQMDSNHTQNTSEGNMGTGVAAAVGQIQGKVNHFASRPYIPLVARGSIFVFSLLSWYGALVKESFQCSFSFLGQSWHR